MMYHTLSHIKILEGIKTTRDWLRRSQISAVSTGQIESRQIYRHMLPNDRFSLNPGQGLNIMSGGNVVLSHENPLRIPRETAFVPNLNVAIG
jgi:hypothetical protein